MNVAVRKGGDIFLLIFGYCGCWHTEVILHRNNCVKKFGIIRLLKLFNRLHF